MDHQESTQRESSDSRLTCSVCGGSFSSDEMIRYRSDWVCAACKPLFFQRVQEGFQKVVSIGPMVYAGFWIRVGAFLIDGWIIEAVNSQVNRPLLIFLFYGPGAMADQLSPEKMQVMTSSLAAFALALLCLLGLEVAAGYALFLSRFGATPGMMALGLKVVRSDGIGLSAHRALGRLLVGMASIGCCFIGCLILVTDREKRTLHDGICDTRVVWDPDGLWSVKTPIMSPTAYRGSLHWLLSGLCVLSGCYQAIVWCWGVGGLRETIRIGSLIGLGITGVAVAAMIAQRNSKLPRWLKRLPSLALITFTAWASVIISGVIAFAVVSSRHPGEIKPSSLLKSPLLLQLISLEDLPILLLGLFGFWLLRKYCQPTTATTPETGGVDPV